MESPVKRIDETQAPLRGNAPEAHAASAPAKKKRNPFAILGIVIALILVGVGGYVVWTANEESTDDAQVEADVVPLGARVSSQVSKVIVKENDTVKAGQQILQLDDADYAAKVKQAEAELDTANAQAQASDAQVTVVDANATGGHFSAEAAVLGSSAGVSNAAAQVGVAQANFSRVELDLKRAKELREANAVSQQQLDNAQSAFDGAQAQLVAAKEAKALADARVGEAKGRLNQSTSVPAQIATARAQAALAHARVKSAEAQLDLARLQLSYTKVMAPSDGVISKLTAHEGQLVQAGQAIGELVPSATYILANFKETQVGKMKPGQRVEISIDAFSHRTFAGTVESLSGGTGARFSLLPPDNASGNFVKVVQRVPVRIAWANKPDVDMRAGLSADVTVTTK